MVRLIKHEFEPFVVQEVVPVDKKLTYAKEGLCSDTCEPIVICRCPTFCNRRV